MNNISTTRGLLIGMLAVLGPVSSLAVAQEMPPPHRMPRIPVSREILGAPSDQQAPTAARAIQGPAVIFDGERIRVAETDLRLFGIVPPQLAASFGPQARATLDSLANGQNVSCLVRDRDRDGRLLATCHAANGTDMALELLRHGLAVTARGSIAGTELANPYLSAEQTAQTQKVGLWSVTLPAASVTATAAPTPATAVHGDATPPVATPPLTAKDDKPTTTAPKSDKIVPSDAPAALLSQPQTPAQTQPNDTQAKISADVVDEEAKADEDNWQPDPDMGFFERYQILIASGLMLTTALSIIAALWGQKSRDKRDEVKAVAAALRGELMAARGICVGRMKSITSEDEDHAAAWPRIRTTLYQAYVGRLGLLGAELARQVASIYGQSSDYASLYNPNGSGYDASKKAALESLARNIDEVLPKLATIEHTGATPATAFYQHRPRSRYDAPSQPLLRPTAAPALQSTSGYRSLSAAPEKEAPTEELTATYEDVTPQAPPKAAQESHDAGESRTENLKPTALWEAVRGFIQNHRNAIAQASPHDEHVSEYAAMIEADMARYPFGHDSSDGYERPNQKKSS